MVPAGVALVLVAGGGLLSMGPPRLTAVNAGLEIEYPWPRAAGAALAAVGGFLFVVAQKSFWARLAGSVFATTALAAAIHLGVYRIQADDQGLLARGLLGSTRVAWREVKTVNASPGLLQVTGSGTVVKVDTTDYRPEQRAALDRTVARRLRE
jgi:hypothetical protein